MRSRTFLGGQSQLGMLPGTMVFVAAGAAAPTLRQLADDGLSSIMKPQLFLTFAMLGCLPIVIRWSVRRAGSSKCVNGQTGLRFLTASSPCSGRQLQNSDDMVIAVSDEESSIGGDEYAVWSIESAISWAANGTVAFVAVADDGFDNSWPLSGRLERYGFRCREPDITIWRDGNSFWSCELGVACGSSISGVATFSSNT
jgi:hypothetical protein